MSRKQRFPPEPATRPDARRPKVSAGRTSAPAPKSTRERAEAPTLPPPRAVENERVSKPHEDARLSGMRSRRPRLPSSPAATVDEVVADLSKDPRRERDDDE
jgi:hypothetical protein